MNKLLTSSPTGGNRSHHAQIDEQRGRHWVKSGWSSKGTPMLSVSEVTAEAGQPAVCLGVGLAAFDPDRRPQLIPGDGWLKSAGREH
jgi:hypothetical protein